MTFNIKDWFGGSKKKLQQKIVQLETDKIVLSNERDNLKLDKEILKKGLAEQQKLIQKLLSK